MTSSSDWLRDHLRHSITNPHPSLVKYRDTYRDPRAELEGEEKIVDERPRQWWQFGGKAAGKNLSEFVTPEDWHKTHLDSGLDSMEVERRRKYTGWNELVTEKENMLLKFIGFFQGPILYGMSSQ